MKISSVTALNQFSDKTGQNVNIFLKLPDYGTDSKHAKIYPHINCIFPEIIVRYCPR